MHRRVPVLLCVVAALALLAGCSAAGSIDMRAVDETELADGASRSVDELGFGYGESDRVPGAVVRAAIANGSTTVNATAAPIEAGLPFASGGAYYNLSATVVGERPGTAVTVEIDYNATAADGTAIAFADLPPADRAALDPLLPQRVPPRREGPDVGVGAIYTDADLEASVLVGDQAYDAVTYEGERYPITVGDQRSVTVATYRYEAARLAANASAYAAHLREVYAFTLSGLSDAERDVLEAAVDGSGYYADSTDDAAFEAVLERFRARDRVVGDSASGTWLVRYDGALYLAELTYGGFLGA